MIENITMIEMDEKCAKEVARWKYEGDYAIYNMPSWEEMCKKEFSLTLNNRRNKEYKAFVTDSLEFLAMCRYVKKNDGIKIGVGVHPDYLSLGIGTAVVKEFTLWLLRKYPNEKLYLDVRAWNRRAVRCYEKSGYKISRIYHQTTPIGTGEFYELHYMNTCI